MQIINCSSVASATNCNQSGHCHYRPQRSLPHGVNLVEHVQYNERPSRMQYLLERFIEVEPVTKGAPVYQPPEEKRKGVFRLVRSAAGDSSITNNLIGPLPRQL